MFPHCLIFRASFRLVVGGWWWCSFVCIDTHSFFFAFKNEWVSDQLIKHTGQAASYDIGAAPCFWGTLVLRSSASVRTKCLTYPQQNDLRSQSQKLWSLRQIQNRYATMNNCCPIRRLTRATVEVQHLSFSEVSSIWGLFKISYEDLSTKNWLGKR